MKQMLPDIQQIILVDTNVQLHTLTFHKVVRQQIRGKVVVLVPPSSAIPFWT